MPIFLFLKFSFSLIKAANATAQDGSHTIFSLSQISLNDEIISF